MTLAVQPGSPPRVADGTGGLRVGGSRVLLELVVRAFEDGATHEAIVQRYATLSLPDVHAVIAYYLRHRADVLAYLAERERRAADVRRRIDAAQGDLSHIRARLEARRMSGGDLL